MKFFEEITTINWWISVFIFGIIFNFFNTFLQRSLDKVVKSRREKSRIKKRFNNQLEKVRIERINSDVVEFEKVKLELNYFKFSIILFSTIGLFIIVLSVLMRVNMNKAGLSSVILSNVLIAISLLTFMRSMYYFSLLSKVYSILQRTKYGNSKNL